MEQVIEFMKNPIAPFIGMAVIVVIVLIVKAISNKQ